MIFCPLGMLSQLATSLIIAEIREIQMHRWLAPLIQRSICKKHTNATVHGAQLVTETGIAMGDHGRNLFLYPVDEQ
jgi:hypothetical protein